MNAALALRAARSELVLHCWLSVEQDVLCGWARIFFRKVQLLNESIYLQKIPLQLWKHGLN